MKGSDYPPRLPLRAAKRQVMMPVEETIRYSLNNTEAEVEWLWTATVGDGNVRLGDNHRFFSLVMVHEQHCTRWIRMALQAAHPHEQQKGHLAHCLNYMRQLALCSADATLEPADILSRDYAKERWNVDHQCHDWSAIYEAMRTNYLEWEAARPHWQKEVDNGLRAGE
ncbi:hypothetical protein EVJ58_g8143 [Rhodofomes roseus]|nr:hypothetical protein EVJ58_g8143 [Rhodofomes roseus]